MRRVFNSTSVMVNFMYTWNYHDNLDIGQCYHDRKTCIIAEPQLICVPIPYIYVYIYIYTVDHRLGK